MDSLDEDDVTAALLLMQQQASRNSTRLREDLFGDENEDPTEDFEPLGGKKRLDISEKECLTYPKKL